MEKDIPLNITHRGALTARLDMNLDDDNLEIPHRSGTLVIVGSQVLVLKAHCLRASF
jgi:hypothetical protein